MAAGCVRTQLLALSGAVHYTALQFFIQLSTVHVQEVQIAGKGRDAVHSLRMRSGNRNGMSHFLFRLELKVVNLAAPCN